MAAIVTLLAMAMTTPSMLTPLWTASKPMWSRWSSIHPAVWRMWPTMLQHCFRNFKEQQERANPFQSQVWQKRRCESATLWILLSPSNVSHRMFFQHECNLPSFRTHPPVPLHVSQFCSRYYVHPFSNLVRKSVIQLTIYLIFLLTILFRTEYYHHHEVGQQAFSSWIKQLTCCLSIAYQPLDFHGDLEAKRVLVSLSHNTPPEDMMAFDFKF